MAWRKNTNAQAHSHTYIHTHTHATSKRSLSGCSGNLVLLRRRFPLHYVSFFSSLQMLPSPSPVQLQRESSAEQNTHRHAHTHMLLNTHICTHSSSNTSKYTEDENVMIIHCNTETYGHKQQMNTSKCAPIVSVTQTQKHTRAQELKG